MTFQVPSDGVCGMVEPQKILGLLLGKKKIHFEKTQNQERMILLCRELDRCYTI